jgi:hypothetical protein
MPPFAAIDLAFLASLSIARQRDDKGDRCASAKEEGRGADEERGPTARICRLDDSRWNEFRMIVISTAYRPRYEAASFTRIQPLSTGF